MKFIFIILMLISIESIYSEVSPPKKTIEKEFAWLLGAWERVESENRFVERWTKITPNHFHAESVATNTKGDTVFSESIDLMRFKDGIYYTVTAKGQNGNESVNFKLTTRKPWVFENKAHDFPQRIIYSHPSPDSLHAWIEGNNAGKPLRVDFKMKKIQSR